jgi:lipoprotein-anchoring transpeptidase ErfK/SrfK
MNSPNLEIYQQALATARKALREGKTNEVRFWASKAAKLDPNKEEPWLFLAAVSKPKASLGYLNQALAINPNSQRARKGIHWAVQRLRKEATQQTTFPVEIPVQIPSSNLVVQKYASPWMNTLLAAIILVGVVLTTGWVVSNTFAKEIARSIDPKLIAEVNLLKETRTPTPTFTYTPTPTATQTSTPTITQTPSPTFTPTITATPEPTQTPEPPIDNESGNIDVPESVNQDRWIDVDLSEQRTYAYEGNTLVNSFSVSTGTWQYPTVTGTYQVYVMYRYADMSGPGYYLPNVPYVMYFYKGYGLHGTYWHNNFGTPMSHGCVNLSTEDAGWLYDWSFLGITVNVHP